MKQHLFPAIGQMAVGTALILSAATQSTAQVNAPSIGIARLGDATVRTLYGLPANVVVDSHVLGEFDAASFSDHAGLLSKNGHILLVRPNFAAVGEYASNEPQPLLNVDGGTDSAIAWLPGTGSLLHWSSGAFVLTTVNGLDRSLTVTSVWVQTPNSAGLLLADTYGSVFEAAVDLNSGNLSSLRALPGMHGHAFRQGSFLLYSDATGLQIAADNGAGVLRTIKLAASDLSFQHISNNWVLVNSLSTGQSWALQLSSTVLNISEIPAPSGNAQEVSK